MNSRLHNEITEFENKLRASGYRQLNPFFVLREGEVFDERTGGVVRFDRHRLERFAEAANRRIAESGDATPIIIGHTKRNKDEIQQPKITGLATRFEVVPFYKTGTYGLQAVPWSKPENIQNFEMHPRRSAEVWTDPDLIDPISILGANTPRLDLGLHRLQRDQSDDTAVSTYRPRVPLTLEMCDMPNDTDTGDKGGSTGPSAPATDSNKAAAAGTVDSPQMAQMQAQLNQLMEMFQLFAPLMDEMKAAGGGMPPAGGGGLPGGPGGGMPGDMGGAPGGPPMPAAAGPAGPGGPGGPGEPQQFNMGGGSPAGFGNTMIPQQLSYGYTQPNPYDPQPYPARQPMQFQAGGYAPTVPAVDPRDRQILQLQRQVQTMEQNMLAQSVNTLLDGLQTEIVIDRKRDFDRLIQCSRQSAQAVTDEVNFMRQTRAKVEAPLPGEAVQLSMQAGPPASPRGNAPMQLSLQDAIQQQGYGMGPDPTLLANGQTNGMPNPYDAMVEAVRNRKQNGGDPMAAYRRIMGGQVDPQTGKTIVPTRG